MAILEDVLRFSAPPPSVLRLKRFREMRGVVRLTGLLGEQWESKIGVLELLIFNMSHYFFVSDVQVSHG